MPRATRGRKLVLIVGHKKALAIAVSVNGRPALAKSARLAGG
jgi:hypothetical protein